MEITGALHCTTGGADRRERVRYVLFCLVHLFVGRSVMTSYEGADGSMHKRGIIFEVV